MATVAKLTLAATGLALVCFAMGSAPRAQSKADDPLEGLWQGYDGELRHAEKQLVALAEATPEDKFTWRPAAGVRSTSEVYMHIAMANFTC